MTRLCARRVALAGFMAVGGSAADADCYDVFGCSNRNEFRSATRGCVTGNPNALGLNRIERANAATSHKAEQTLGCPE
jgi:hypothetical protein